MRIRGKSQLWEPLPVVRIQKNGSLLYKFEDILDFLLTIDFDGKG
jgi:hypothetical protein